MNRLAHIQNIAPSAQFLNPKGLSDIHSATGLSDRDTSFVGSSTGFLPPNPLPSLPSSHKAWQDAASTLPEVCRSGEWIKFISTLPELTLSGLPDQHLLRANQCLGAIAHAIKNVANAEVPASIMKPWTTIGKRLQRPTASFNSLDWFIYNYEFIPLRFTQCVKGSTTPATNSPKHVTDVWQQTRPQLTVTGTMTETHFITGCHAIEYAASKLPGYIATAQQAALNKNNECLYDMLLRITQVIETMTIAFRSADMRPMSATYTDGIEWGRVIGVVGLGVVPGEKTISGLLFPSVHLLDVFLGRSLYNTEMGVLESTDRKWLPPLHREFLKAVTKVSVLDYVQERRTTQPQLFSLFRHTLFTFADEGGFLGKHRLRIIGFLELSMKVGRPTTAAGTSTAGWQRRTWRHINRAMIAGIHERLKICGEQGSMCQATVSQIEPVNKNDDSVFRIVLNTNGCLIYSPGDHIGLMPKNRKKLIHATLEVLEMQPDERVVVKSKKWKKMLQKYYGYSGMDDKDNEISMSAKHFLSMARLQPFDFDMACSLIDAMFVVNPAVVNYLRYESATNFPIALQIIRDTGLISTFHLRTKLDSIFEPLAPRYYSVASHMVYTPTSVELIVGRVRYRSHSKLSKKYGTVPWLESTDEALDRHSILMPSLAAEYLQEFMHSEMVTPSSSSVNSDPNGSTDDCSSIADSFDTTKTDRTKTDASNQRLQMAVKELSAIGAQKVSTSTQYSVRANHIAQVLTSDHTRKTRNEQTLEGISSSYVASLKIGDQLPLFVVPELDFRIPEAHDVPIVMLSLGTGIAPFRSFLKELILRKQLGETVRKAWLILGVQNRERIPFLDEIEEAVCVHKVADISIAFSREDIDLDAFQSQKHLIFQPGRRKRLQALFEQNSDVSYRLWSMLSQGGHIFACGKPDLEPLTRDLVSFTVKRYASTMWARTFFETNRDLASLATEYADRLFAERRLHIDAYYSGYPTSMNTFYTYADVAQHRHASDCWVIFHNGVYNLTKYLAIHPGGPKLLLDKAGRDITEDFKIAHGGENSRIASMMSPYRVGTIEEYWKQDMKMKRVMDAWSVPLLNRALEHKSVFTLDVNRFSSLCEPTSHTSFKSQIDQPNGLASIASKFWSQYEQDMFKLIHNAMGKDDLGAAVSALGLVEFNHLDYTAVQKKFNLCRRGQSEADQNTPAEECIGRYYRFLDDIVTMCVEVQRVVEKALRQASTHPDFQDVCTVLLSSLIKTVSDGLGEAYEALERNKLSSNWT